RSDYAFDGSVAWLEDKIPGGTRLYINSPPMMVRKPLPTSSASERIWAEVMDAHAYEKKFDSALHRLGLARVHYPHAFSEDIIFMERMARRPWWVLGSRPGVNEPRYDIVLSRAAGFVTGVEDIPAEFRKTGGVVLWRGKPNPELGIPAAHWAGASGEGAYIYCSPDTQFNPTGR